MQSEFIFASLKSVYGIGILKWKLPSIAIPETKKQLTKISKI